MNRETVILIPTRNRPTILKELLSRLATMTDEFDRIIIVDSSDHLEHTNLVQHLDQIAKLKSITRLVKSTVGSLTYQKNLGLQECGPADIVQILDDDVLPSPGYIQAMFRLLQEHELAGISGVTQEVKPPTFFKDIFSKLFLLTAASQGAVSRGGIGTPVYPKGVLDEIVRSHWLIGCSMWDLSLIGTARFNQKFKGSSLFEDVEFSSRVYGKMAVAPAHTLQHLSSEENRPNDFVFWYRFSRNRFEVIKIVTRFPRLVFFWSSLGVILQLVFGSQRNKAECILGLWRGAISAFKNGDYV